MEYGMKKVFFTVCFGLFVCCDVVQACFCIFEIEQAYQALTNKVTTDIDAQTESVRKLIKEIERNTEDIKKQNEVIAKIIRGEKERAVQNSHIIFLIKKITELKTAGEM
jgi:predicted Holliday junction resolvase-like endonuclease